MRIYTDGSCLGSGDGGWAWTTGDSWSGHDSGFEADTTNQRMELKAALEAVRAHPDPGLVIVSDSAYVVNCFLNGWWEGWLARGWTNSERKPVANRDLWEPLIQLVMFHDGVTFEKVKGHSGDLGNEEADRLAGEAAAGGRYAATRKAVLAQVDACDYLLDEDHDYGYGGELVTYTSINTQGVVELVMDIAAKAWQAGHDDICCARNGDAGCANPYGVSR